MVFCQIFICRQFVCAHLVASKQQRRTYLRILRNMDSPMAGKPSRNIEIKAQIASEIEFQKKLAVAKELSGSDATLIVQHDVFFNSAEGRLKLRYLKDKASELIYYSRPDTAGPKLSQFHKIDIAEPETLEVMLTLTNGVKGVVDKTRHLFMYGQTRLHLDEVKDLGHFLEFEVCLREDQTIDQGQAIAEDLMAKFGLEENDLIVGAYMDKLLAK